MGDEMRRAIVVVLAAVAVMFSGLTVVAPAQATFGDSRQCVTNKEYRAIKKGMPKTTANRILDGKGTRVNAKTRQYSKCGEQQRVVRVTYNRKYGNNRAKVARKAQITAVPSAPRNVAASAGNETIRVSWQVPSSSGEAAVSGYRVQHRQVGGSWRLQSTSSRAITLAGLANGSAHEVRVSAVNSFGASAWSRALTATPSGVPSVVQNVAVTPMNESLQVDWAAPASTGGRPVTGYVVQSRRASSTTWTDTAVSADQRYATITSLANGKQQQVRVAALNANGRGPASSVVTGTPIGVPEAPQAVALQAGDRSLEVTWTAPDLGGAPSAERVWVQHRAHGEQDWVEVERDSSAVSHTLTGLTNGTTYEVRVAYENTSGLGPWSQTVTGMPSDFVVTTLRDVVADDGECSLREAIANANDDSQNTTTDCPAGSGPDTITFAEGLTGTIVLDGTHLAVTDDLTIAGPGADVLTVDANRRSRAFLLQNADVTLTGLTIRDGRETGFTYGGVIRNSRGTLTITNCTISGGYAYLGGGGIYNSGGTLVVTNSTISDNAGSGIHNTDSATISSPGIATVTGSTISNTAGTGIVNYGAVTVTDSTIVGNSSTIVGTTSGIGNVGGSVTIERSVVAADEGAACSGSPVNDGGHNLASDATCGFALTGDPLLGALADNGGPTQTMLPAAGSPVIDAGGACTGTDQRGMSRPQGSACDIGAVEVKQ